MYAPKLRTGLWVEGGSGRSARWGDRSQVTIAADDARRRTAEAWTTFSPLSVVPTKLEPPYRRPGIIDRPRLLARLDQVDTRIVALVAPAGYGKSTLAAQFAEASGRRVAWLSADGRDDDPATLVRSIAAALDQVEPLPATTVASVAIPGPSVWTHAVPALGAALRGSSDARLVIDDVDRIAGRESVDVLLTLAAHLRDPRQLVLVGRTLGNLPAARLQSTGLMSVVSREDLAFDEAEIGGLLEAAGVPAGFVDPRTVSERTEGWAAGVYLTALSLVGSALEAPSAAPPFVATAPASERLVEDYLRSEVLAELPANDVAFLLRSSVLDRLSGPLCDHILERDGSGADLDRLERQNLLLIPLDRERIWYRYHHLLGDFLRSELERLGGHEARGLRRRAADWHASNGLAEQALEYAMAGDDEDLAAGLAGRLAQDAVNAGRTETVRGWFDWFEARDAGPRQPRLAAMGAMMFAFDGDASRAAQWADHADRAPGRDDPTDPAAGVTAISRSCLMRSGLDEVVRDARFAERVVADDDPWRVAALVSLATAVRLRGDLDVAEPILHQAVAIWEQGSNANTAVVLALVELTDLAMRRGDRPTAEQYIRKARSILQANGLAEQAVAVPVDALHARLVLSRGAADQARAIVAHAQRLRPKLGVAVPWLAVRTRLDLVRAHLAMGDAGGAHTLMAEVRDLFEARPDLGTLIDDARELDERVAAMGNGIAGPTTLTMAELRLLPLLTTHLSFREIGERLFISQNTVKTEAISIYRKLDATSRSEAVERATAIGLLGWSATTDTD